MTNLLLKGTPIGEIKGVLFDKDGTLSNSETHLIKLAEWRIQKALDLFAKEQKDSIQTAHLKNLLTKAYGLSPHGGGINPNGMLAIAPYQDNLISTATIFSLLGKSWPCSLKLAQEVFISIESPKDSSSSKASDNRDLLPGALSFLKKLQQVNIKCAVISNDTSNGIEGFLTRNNIEQYITAYWSADFIPAKPNPEAVKGLCRKIKLYPSQCALIGDADSDLNMAKDAGIPLVLGYASGWSVPPQLKAHHHLIHHWDDLTVGTNPKLTSK